ncbi:HesB/YadR/YfhF family protein [Neisseria gonorrhoeae SK-93-1035]|nr:HesB/YadR/YfhF family protein [Neisseria gonorrhoeae SK-93-1035]
MPSEPPAASDPSGAVQQGRNMITLTENAAKHINDYLAKRGKGLGVRLGVKTSGCSGMAYNLEFVDEANGDDLIFERHGARIYIDPKSLVYLDGTQVDYTKEDLQEGFKFENPNVKDSCGCGESFHV